MLRGSANTASSRADAVAVAVAADRYDLAARVVALAVAGGGLDPGKAAAQLRAYALAASLTRPPEPKQAKAEKAKAEPRAPSIVPVGSPSVRPDRTGLAAAELAELRGDSEAPEPEPDVSDNNQLSDTLTPTPSP